MSPSSFFFISAIRSAHKANRVFSCISQHRPVSTPAKHSTMFTYDGCGSQLEWFSTLTIAKAPSTTPETKHLRKV